MPNCAANRPILVMSISPISAVWTLARALLAAADVVADGRLARLTQARYADWQSELGQRIEQHGMTLARLADHAVAAGLDPKPPSSRQELA
jgi:xylose isomerase